MPLLGKASRVGPAMVIVGCCDAKDPDAERYERNERMPNPEERIAQLWLGQLLKEPGMMEAFKWYVFRKRPGASVGDKFEDIRQMALLGTWQRIARAIAQGGEVQLGNTTEKSAAADEQDVDDQDTELPLDVDRVLWRAITGNDKAAFQRMAKTLIFNQIVYRGGDLTRKETQETIQTVHLAPETVSDTPPRQNENLAPNDYSEPDSRSARNTDPRIDPDLHHPETREEVEKRENEQSEGQRLKESWLKWLWAVHDRTTDPEHKKRLKACIAFERLAFIDDGKVSINERIRKPEDEDPFLYHGILGRTHGARERLAKQYDISLSYFEKELKLMRSKHWPSWVATVIEEQN